MNKLIKEIEVKHREMKVLMNVFKIKTNFEHSDPIK